MKRRKITSTCHICGKSTDIIDTCDNCAEVSKRLRIMSIDGIIHFERLLTHMLRGGHDEQDKSDV